MKILSGPPIAQSIQQQVAEAIRDLHPGLAFILVGEHPSSHSYVRAKQRACQKVGMGSTIIKLPTTVSRSELELQIDALNQDHAVHGILIQLPLPAHLSERAILSRVHPSKDVDGFHPLNAGKLLLGEEDGFIPCTPLGIQRLLQEYQVPIEGKHVVILGRSNIVGKPLAALLMQRKAGSNATVTIAHSASEGLIDITRSADILIAATGRPLFIKRDMIKPGAAVVDVGITRLDGRIVGDVDFAEVAPIAGFISPVPGGVGPMTIAMLLQNTLTAFQRAQGK